MSARGFVLAEDTHIVNILPPVDVTGGATGDVFSMANHSHATIIVQVGVSAAAFTKIIVNECTSLAAAGATAIAYYAYAEETAAGDTLAARESVAAAGRTPSANDNIFYVIELDADDLSSGSHFVQLSLTNGSNSVIGSAVAILSGARYAEASSATAIA